MSLELKAFDGDVDWLWELERSSFNSADQMNRDELADFARDEANRVVLIEENGLRIGAFLLTVHDPTFVYLESVAIRPEHRAHGCGARALSLLLARLATEGFLRVQLHVRASSPPVRLYERLGFRFMAKIPAFYDDGEVAWLMQLDLPVTRIRP